MAATLLLAGCVTPKVVVKPQPTTNPETSYKLITPKSAPHYDLKPGQSATLPEPLIGRFSPPEYPSSLAYPGMPVVRIKAQLVFASSGHVQDVFILTDSYAGAGKTLFEDAVRKAAMRWAFTPLVFEQSVGGGATPITFKREAKPFSLWFEFRFAMVNGKPSVSTSKRE
ncbi:MAG: hypothetical protein ACREPS_07975 [Rhodanobacteraceae bacterium]